MFLQVVVVVRLEVESHAAQGGEGEELEDGGWGGDGHLVVFVKWCD